MRTTFPQIPALGEYKEMTEQQQEGQNTDNIFVLFYFLEEEGPQCVL